MHASKVLRIVIPTALVMVLILVIVFVLVLKHRRSAKKYLLPVNEKPGQSFVHRHLEALRSWRKSTATATNAPPQTTTKPDPRHTPFLTQPPTSHQPDSAYKDTCQQFKERQQQRDQDRMTRQPEQEGEKPEGVRLKPRSASWWRNAVKEMEAQRPWWEKLKDKLGV
jgi:hypothetical protein